MAIVIGIDNGVTGNIAILNNGRIKWFCPMPVFKDLNYTKSKQFVSRVNVKKLVYILNESINDSDDKIAILERPMVNPMRFKASASALRCLEATLVTLEICKIPYQFIDSKEWQKVMLPINLRKEELKIGADRVAKRLFPEVADKIKEGNGDALLIAKYWEQKTNGEKANLGRFI